MAKCIRTSSLIVFVSLSIAFVSGFSRNRNNQTSTGKTKYDAKWNNFETSGPQNLLEPKDITGKVSDENNVRSLQTIFFIMKEAEVPIANVKIWFKGLLFLDDHARLAFEGSTAISLIEAMFLKQNKFIGFDASLTVKVVGQGGNYLLCNFMLTLDDQSKNLQIDFESSFKEALSHLLDDKSFIQSYIHLLKLSSQAFRYVTNLGLTKLTSEPTAAPSKTLLEFISEGIMLDIYGINGLNEVDSYLLKVVTKDFLMENLVSDFSDIEIESLRLSLRFSEEFYFNKIRVDVQAVLSVRPKNTIPFKDTKLSRILLNYLRNKQKTYLHRLGILKRSIYNFRVDLMAHAPSSMPSTISPTHIPTWMPSYQPFSSPSTYPNNYPSFFPSVNPSEKPSEVPVTNPSGVPTISNPPSFIPDPSSIPSDYPSFIPSQVPSNSPSLNPSEYPSVAPNPEPSNIPTIKPTVVPSGLPSPFPSVSSLPTSFPSESFFPSYYPSILPSFIPSAEPTTCEDDASYRSRYGFACHVYSYGNCGTMYELGYTLREVAQLMMRCRKSCDTCWQSKNPSNYPSKFHTVSPSQGPSINNSNIPSVMPSVTPSLSPSNIPSILPSRIASDSPSETPDNRPSNIPSRNANIPSTSGNFTSNISTTSPRNSPSNNPRTPSRSPSTLPKTFPLSSPSSGPNNIPSSYHQAIYPLPSFSSNGHPSEPFNVTKNDVTRTRPLCENDPFFSDKFGLKCDFYDYFDCSQMGEIGLGQIELQQILRACPKECNSDCIDLEAIQNIGAINDDHPVCEDDPLFRDRNGFSCKHYSDLACNILGTLGLNKREVKESMRKCKFSCKKCSNQTYLKKDLIEVPFLSSLPTSDVSLKLTIKPSVSLLVRTDLELTQFENSYSKKNSSQESFGVEDDNEDGRSGLPRFVDKPIVAPRLAIVFYSVAGGIAIIIFISFGLVRIQKLKSEVGNLKSLVYKQKSPKGAPGRRAKSPNQGVSGRRAKSPNQGSKYHKEESMLLNELLKDDRKGLGPNRKDTDSPKKIQWQDSSGSFSQRTDDITTSPTEGETLDNTTNYSNLMEPSNMQVNPEFSDKISGVERLISSINKYANVWTNESNETKPKDQFSPTQEASSKSQSAALSAAMKYIQSVDKNSTDTIETIYSPGRGVSVVDKHNKVLGAFPSSNTTMRQNSPAEMCHSYSTKRVRSTPTKPPVNLNSTKSCNIVRSPSPPNSFIKSKSFLKNSDEGEKIHSRINGTSPVHTPSQNFNSDVSPPVKRPNINLSRHSTSISKKNMLGGWTTSPVNTHDNSFGVERSSSRINKPEKVNSNESKSFQRKISRGSSFCARPVSPEALQSNFLLRTDIGHTSKKSQTSHNVLPTDRKKNNRKNKEMQIQAPEQLPGEKMNSNITLVQQGIRRREEGKDEKSSSTTNISETNTDDWSGVTSEDPLALDLRHLNANMPSNEEYANYWNDSQEDPVQQIRRAKSAVIRSAASFESERTSLPQTDNSEHPIEILTRSSPIHVNGASEQNLLGTAVGPSSGSIGVVLTNSTLSGESSFTDETNGLTAMSYVTEGTASTSKTSKGDVGEYGEHIENGAHGKHLFPQHEVRHVRSEHPTLPSRNQGYVDLRKECPSRIYSTNLARENMNKRTPQERRELEQSPRSFLDSYNNDYNRYFKGYPVNYGNQMGIRRESSYRASGMKRVSTGPINRKSSRGKDFYSERERGSFSKKQSTTYGSKRGQSFMGNTPVSERERGQSSPNRSDSSGWGRRESAPAAHWEHGHPDQSEAEFLLPGWHQPKPKIKMSSMIRGGQKKDWPKHKSREGRDERLYHCRRHAHSRSPVEFKGHKENTKNWSMTDEVFQGRRSSIRKAR